MEHIAKLTNLEDLMLFGCPSVTNEGLAKLRTLKSLKKLNLSFMNIDISGLEQLNTLENISNLYACDIDGREIKSEKIVATKRLKRPEVKRQK